MGFWEAALTFWTLPFFIVWGIAILLCFAGALSERYWISGFLVVGTVTVLWVTGTVDFGYLLLNHYFACAIAVGIYFLGGLIWITARWGLYVDKVSEKRPEAIKNFLKNDFGSVVSSKQDYEERELQDDFNRRKRAKQRDGAKDDETDSINTEAKLKAKIDAARNEIAQAAEAWKTSILETTIAPEEPDWLNSKLESYAFPSVDPNSDNYLGKATDQPRFMERKRRFFSYYFYWPIDLPIYFVGTFIKDLWRMIVRWLQDSYDRYAGKRIRQKINMENN